MDRSVTPSAAEASASPAFEQEWLSDDQSGEIVGCGKRVIRDAVRTGKLRAAVLDRRGTLRIHRSWLREWMERLADERPFAVRAGESRHDAADYKRMAAGERNESSNDPTDTAA